MFEIESSTLALERSDEETMELHKPRPFESVNS
jgi:hypothetical protein